MKFKILSILILMFFVKISFCEDSVILYVSDNIHSGDNFVAKYTEMLQTLMDDNYGKNAIKLKKFSRFDFNTTECLEFLKYFNTKNYLPKTVILTIGEANQYNFKGFSSYLSEKKNMKPTKIINKKLKQINEEIRDIYEQKSSLLAIVGQQMFLNNTKEYKPQIVPIFYVLNDKFIEDTNTIASIPAYSYAWELIRTEKYNQARDFLFSVISKKINHSMFYYALGSLYLLEQKPNAETNALKIFEEGILVDMLNRRNMCYRGLMYLCMSYKGEISNDILYFVRAVSSVAGDVSEEITAIMALNTSSYEIKHQAILNWALNDLDKIKELYAKNNVNLIFASYPDDVKINNVVKNHIEESHDGILFFQNRFEFTGNMDYSLYNLSKKMFSFLKDRKIIK